MKKKTINKKKQEIIPEFIEPKRIYDVSNRYFLILYYWPENPINWLCSKLIYNDLKEANILALGLKQLGRIVKIIELELPL